MERKGQDIKFKRSIFVLAAIIAVLSIISCLWGLFSSGGEGTSEFKSIYGETIKLYGRGIYQYESIAQKLSLGVQDTFTLFFAVPLLLISLVLSVKGFLKGRLLLAGTLAYFLYAYISYTFLRMYNPLFLVYMVTMAASLYALILCMMSFDMERLGESFNPRMPVRFIGGFLIFLAIGLIFTWLPPIIGSLAEGTVPIDLEHYTTLGFEALDLGFIVPTLLLSAVLLIKRKLFGYLLSSIMVMQSITMTLLVSILTVVQVRDGMQMPFIMMIMFPIFTLVTIFCLIIILRNVKER